MSYFFTLQQITIFHGDPTTPQRSPQPIPQDLGVVTPPTFRIDATDCQYCYHYCWLLLLFVVVSLSYLSVALCTCQSFLDTVCCCFVDFLLPDIITVVPPVNAFVVFVVYLSLQCLRKQKQQQQLQWKKQQQQSQQQSCNGSSSSSSSSS